MNDQFVDTLRSRAELAIMDRANPVKPDASRISILVVGPWVPEPKGGGVRTSVATLVQSLARNHSVTVFVESWSRRSLSRERVASHLVYSRRIRSPIKNGRVNVTASIAWLFDLPATLRDLRRICREQSIEVIHLHQTQASNLIFSLLRLLGGPPYVATFHGRDAREYPQRPPLARWMIRQVVRRASGFTAVSQSLAQVAQAEIPGVSNVRVIRNGVPRLGQGALDGASLRNEKLPSRFFVSVGRLYPLANRPLKGHDLAIRAWGRLRGKHPDVHLVIAGDDTERADYEALMRECGCTETVHMLGAVPRSELLSIVRQSMGLVAASRSEGMPIAVLEAGALGRPVIASDIPAFLEFLTHEIDSLIVPTESYEPIADAVTRLIEEPALGRRLGQALLRKVTDQYSAEEVANRYVEAFHDALVRSRSLMR
jgi:phosphatidylinositol alpha-mannosyltransferase